MVFSLQTVSRPVISLQTVKTTSVYNMPQDPGQPLLKNTRKHFVERFFSHLFFLQCANFFRLWDVRVFFVFSKKNSFFASGGRGHIVESFYLVSSPRNVDMLILKMLKSAHGRHLVRTLRMPSRFPHIMFTWISVLKRNELHGLVFRCICGHGSGKVSKKMVLPTWMAYRCCGGGW